MPTKCPNCGREVNNETRDCQCGVRIRELRLEVRCINAEQAIKGWRTVSATLAAALKRIASGECELNHPPEMCNCASQIATTALATEYS